jgi:hypothetical protein
LYLVLHPTGRKGWALRYRRQGNPRNLTFTTAFPDMSLAAARAEAESKLDELARGIDPAAIQAEAVQQEAPNANGSDWYGESWRTASRVGCDFESHTW